jgi:hypothetical protein
MSTSMRFAMLRQLDRYRIFVSQNDVLLHHRYKQVVDIVFPNTSKERNNRNYDHASVFRESMYVDAYNSLYGMLTNRWKRGCHHIMHGFHIVEIHVNDDSFNVLFNPFLLTPTPSEEELRKFRRNNKHYESRHRQMPSYCDKRVEAQAPT